MGGYVMAQYTQKAIIETFEKMLIEMPFDKITVSALVRRCEISSNTFYYHYSDIYDLLDVWLRGELSTYASGKPPYDDFKLAMKDFLRDCVEHSAIIYHIFNSLSRDRMERFVFTLGEDVFYRYVCRRAAAYEVPEARLKEMADVCRYSFAGLFLRFLWGRMKEDIDAMVDGYSEVLDGLVMGTAMKYPRRA